MAHNRPQRIAQLIQEDLGRMFTRGFKDPRIGFVTITGVKISPDLKQATVYYSVIGADAEKAKTETKKGLDAAAGFIRRELGQSLKLRYTPEIRFVFDEAIERGDRIERLLREVRTPTPAPSESPDEEKGDG